MRYHFVVNGFSEEWMSELGEFCGFRRNFLKGHTEGETIVLVKTMDQAEEIRKYVAKEILLIQASQYLAESVLEPLCELMESEDLYVFGHDYMGTELAVRAAVRKKGSSVVSVHGLEIQSHVTAKKMVYTNHMEGRFCMKAAPCCISIANGMEQILPQEGEGGIIREIRYEQEQDFILERKMEVTESAKGLESAKFVVVAGRGAKNKEQVERLEEAAKLLGGELGVSRPAAMNAWAPLQKMVGVSGAMIHPEICITAGVSGAAALYAGIEKSQFIAAVNTDEKAPIMKKADVAIADDFAAVMDALRMLIEK